MYNCSHNLIASSELSVGTSTTRLPVHYVFGRRSFDPMAVARTIFGTARLSDKHMSICPAFLQ
jgi:hypothetical protein